MIPLPIEVAQALPGILAIVFSLSAWFFLKREHRKLRARYFAKHGRYPGEPKQTPAE